MKISFVIPSYNSVTWLPHAVSSCLEQSYKNVEIIIVDDNSTDLTCQYLKSLETEKKVRIITNVVNMGRSGSRNIGNKAAEGAIICVLDADDIAEPKRAEWMAKKFESNGAQYIYGSARIIEADGAIISEHRACIFDKVEAGKTLLNKIIHSTVAYTKDLAIRFPYRGIIFAPNAHDISKLGIDDWAQQTELANAGILLDHTPQILSSYRLRKGQTVETRDEQAVRAAKEAFLIELAQAKEKVLVAA